MAREENRLQIVDASDMDQELMIVINRDQLLRASLLKLIDKKYIPFYTFVQQPTAMLKPFGAMCSNEAVKKLAIIPRITFPTSGGKQHDQHEDGDENALAITLYSTAAEAEGVDSKFCTNNEIVESPAVAGFELTRAPRPQCSYFERTRNWIIRRLARSKGNRWDSSYVHLQTDEQFRSLVAVHKFIVHGLLPERRKGKKGEVHNDMTMNSSLQISPARHVRGDKLLNRRPVGHYNHTTGKICRNEMPRVGGDSPSIPIGSGSKRKREEETIVQPEVSNVGHGTSQLIFTLYDFEPIS